MAVAKIPPGPKGRFFLGHTLDYMGDSLGFLTRCAREHGDVVKLRLGRSSYYLLNHPMPKTAAGSCHGVEAG